MNFLSTRDRPDREEYLSPSRRSRRTGTLPPHFEFIVPVKENSKSAARAAVEGLYLIIFG